MKYMVFDVGCIECGEGSEIVGFYKTIKAAKNNREKAEAAQKANWHGQHEFLIFDTETKEEVY